ncbi:MAG: hypothetical protein ACR2HE_06935 [Casimicrobiaceae bacterium]
METPEALTKREQVLLKAVAAVVREMAAKINAESTAQKERIDQLERFTLSSVIELEQRLDASGIGKREK